MKVASLVVVSAIMLVLLPHASAQNLEFMGGWAHSTGDFGLDGLDAGVAAMFTSRVGLAFNFDSMWDTSKIGTFELTSVGQTVVKNFMEDGLIGPRVFFAQKKIKKKYVLSPFGEAQFGESYLSTTIQQQQTGLNQTASDTAFSWMLGGGVDYVVAGHWSVRGNLDFLRTHFSDTGQSRLRFVLGVAYTLRHRGVR
jgi:opacity protein-like surface antigen